MAERRHVFALCLSVFVWANPLSVWGQVSVSSESAKIRTKGNRELTEEVTTLRELVEELRRSQSALQAQLSETRGQLTSAVGPAQDTRSWDNSKKVAEVAQQK